MIELTINLDTDKSEGGEMRLIDNVLRDVAELPDRTSPEGWPEAMLVTADELRLILERQMRDIVVQLIAVAHAAWHAADNSEEMEGENGREHSVSSNDFDALCDALDELPDDRPGYTIEGCGPAKAEWALIGQREVDDI